MSLDDEQHLPDIHQQYENFRFIPKIEQMKLDEYVININITNKICIVKNKLLFTPLDAEMSTNVSFFS
jgi:hypothetical protein